MNEKHLNMNRLAILIFMTFVVSNTCLSQGLLIDQTYTPEEMIMDFFGSDNITISNISYSGDLKSIGFFESQTDEMPINTGLVLSTGFVETLSGQADGTESSSTSGETDIDINTSTGSDSYNAAVIEFDFMVDESQYLEFNYVFSSEEYPEFVNSIFNDAFLFIISGEGIEGPYSNNGANISLLPNGEIVSINTVNDQYNIEYYINNADGQDVTMDGMTFDLPASFMAEQGIEYHIKIVVADLLDTAFDSAVFLGYNSLGNSDSLVPPANFSFVQSGNKLEFTNESKYARDYQWDFGNGLTSNERFPEPVDYQVNGGEYTVQLVTRNYCCSDTITQVINISNTSAIEGIENHNINIYPNPINHTLNIDFDDVVDLNLSIKNLMGESIYIARISEQNNQFDLSNIASGLYFIVLSNGAHQRIQYKIMIE